MRRMDDDEDLCMCVSLSVVRDSVDGGLSKHAILFCQFSSTVIE